MDHTARLPARRVLLRSGALSLVVESRKAASGRPLYYFYNSLSRKPDDRFVEWEPHKTFIARISTMKKVAIILTQEFADWEYALVAGTGGTFYGFDVQFFTPETGEIRSQGGLSPLSLRD